MLWLTVRKEIAHNMLSLRFAVAYGLLVFLVLMAVYLMRHDHAARDSTYRREVDAERERIQELARVTDPRQQYEQLERMDLKGSRKPQPTSILARGLEASLPITVTWNDRPVTSGDRLGRNWMLEVFRSPDLVYVVNLVVSLLALLFVFDSVCGEKESGTLKLLLANAVPRDTVLLGKWIGGFLSVAAPLVVASLAGFIYLYISGAVSEARDAWRFAAALPIALLYISALFSAGLAISAASHRRATALIVSLLVWTIGVLVVPNLAPVVAQILAPVPGPQVIANARRAIEKERNLLLRGVSKRSIYSRFSKEEQNIKEMSDRRIRKLNAFHSSRLERQIALTQNLARLSPSASYLFASARLAGTGPSLHGYFRQAREQYRRDRDAFFQSLSDAGIGHRNNDWNTPEGWFQPDTLPRLNLFRENLRESLDAALPDILLLVAYNVLFFMIAYVAFLRYDVT